MADLQSTVATPANHIEVAVFDVALTAPGGAVAHMRLVFPDGSILERYSKADGTGQVIRTPAGP